jgi:phage portal protein BeeE
MNPAFLSRLHAAAALIFKSGAPFPFNKIMPYDATGGEKLYRAFEQSTWVMRAIKKIAGPIAAVDLNFTRAGERFHQADLEAFWEEPGAGMTRTDLIEATVGWLKLEGEAFWILDDSWLAPFAEGGPIGGGHRPPLQVARPDRMRHVVKNGVLAGWEYVDASGHRALLLPEQVIQIKMWNPYNDWRGMAELKPCRDAAEADFLAGKFNLNLMRNNGDQGVYVIAKDGLPLDGQRQQIIDQIREKRELAQRGVFKPVFLDGDISIEDPKIRVPDADFIAARLQNRHEVFIAMGVPASMADVKASYSIGSASDWFMLIAETCIPLGEKICQGINQVLRRQGAAEVRASLNWDEHPVIQAVRRERADTAQKYFSMGVPLQVLNDYLDLELPPCPAWDQGYVPAKLAPIGQEEGDAQPGAAMDDTVALMRRELGPVARLKKALRGERENMGKEKDGMDQVAEEDGLCGAFGVRRLAGAFQSGSKLPHSKSLSPGELAQRQPMVRAFVSRFNRELMKARGDTLRRLEGNGDAIAIFDVEGFAQALETGLRPLLAAALQKAGEMRFAESGRTEVSALPADAANEFLADREEIWRQEAERIGREIEEAAGLAEKEGKTAAVRARFNEIAKRTAPALAWQEIGAAVDCGLRAGVRLPNANCGLSDPTDAQSAVGEAGLIARMGRMGKMGRMGGMADGALSGGAESGSKLPHSKGAAAPLRRMLHPEVRVVDARNGIVDYIASDESIDSFKEVIRAGGWRFTNFAKNSPFVDSHDYSTIEKCLGKVIDFRVEGARLIERVQWAIDVPENKLAQIGWKMTQAGYLKAVSVGFFPVKYVTPSSGEEWTRQLQELGLPADAPVRTIYTEQEQVELSCCVVGANPNALAKAYQAGAINDADIETLSQEFSQRENGRAADCPAQAAPAREQARAGFLEVLHRAIKQNSESKL